jgi:hypothetical protein
MEFEFPEDSLDGKLLAALKLMDELGYDVELVYKKKQVDMQNA